MRFKVIEGSKTDHCCFEATVVDTYIVNEFNEYDVICECLDIDDAKIVCNALNEYVEG